MLKMISPDQALEVVRANAALSRLVEVPLEQAAGLVLAGDVHADRDFPPFARAMMDGFAARVSDAGLTPELVGEVAAGQSPTVEVGHGRCVSVMTGAPCPPNTEVVVPVEQATLEDGRVKLPEALTLGKHIAPRGCECPAGTLVLPRGQRITPLSTAVLAAVGCTVVPVHRPPRLAIISTGSELCPAHQAPGEFQIRDTNSPMLAAQARAAGLELSKVTGAADTPASLSSALEQAADADIVMLSGGVSMGRYDLVPGALREHGVMLLFHKVTQKPGKPMLFGRKDDRLFFGLPGNPLASHLCFHRYVLPAARKMAGFPARPCRHDAALTRPLHVRGERTLFMLASGRFSSGGLEAEPLTGSGSADIFFKQLANGYIQVKPGERRLAAGDQVAFEFLGACP